MLFCSNALLQAMGIVYRTALSRAAGAEALGLNSLVMQLYGMIVSVCISGLNVAVSALAARRGGRGAAPLLKGAFLIFGCLWLICAFPTALLGRTVSGRLFGDEKLFGTLLLMLLCIFMTGTENLLKSLHMGLKHVRECAASELCEQAVRFALVILLLRKAGAPSDEKAVFLIMLGMTASETVSVSFLCISYVKNISSGKSIPEEKPPVREISSIAFPAAATAFSSNAFASVGSLLLPISLSAYGMTRQEALSLIGVMNTSAVPLAMLPMAFAGAVSAVIMPEISQRVSAKGDPRGLIRKAFALTGAAALLSGSVLAPFYESISGALFGMAIEKGVFILILLKAAVIFFQVLSVAVLNGFLMQRTVLCFAAIGEAYQLVLVLLLTPVLGIAGYCLGSLAGELFRLALNVSSISSRVKSYGFSRDNMLKSNRSIKDAR